LIYENIDWTRNNRVRDCQICSALTPLLTEPEQKTETAENDPFISTGALEYLLTMLKWAK
jgi:hypothetical protein